MLRRLLASLAPLVPLLAPAVGQAAPVDPTIAGCPVFPADNPWNQRVDQLPVAPHSSQTVARIGLTSAVHAGFGPRYDGAPSGIPFAVVSGTTQRVRAKFAWASQSDRGPYPLPPNVPIEGGRHSSGDRHVIVVDRATCTDYELYNAHPLPHGEGWTAGSGAIFDMHSDRLRPPGWTSADAAGLPILPGLARYSEVKAGVIDHALRFSAPCTAFRYVYPARHASTNCGAPFAPPMGLRVRLRASVNIAHLSYQARIIATALKRYGMILADNGPSWFVSGTPNQHWDDTALHTLGRLTGRDFQVVNTDSLPRPAL
jgi:hypothetical protein